ncbi:MAG: OmpH family outer membrane protein [Bacteroidia bacterium]|nr:OmpH family outer membrane protein [Bacteroidia bacterium]MDW8332718.1 OmpH family outer membrane protein [Bacteroidia bacterium]
MKRIALILAVSMCASGVFAQKFGVIDSQFIFENMPEYTAVQQEIDATSQQWQKELDEMYAKIEKMYDEYRAKEVLLSKEEKERQQNNIMNEERKAKELQKKRFGYDGELFKMREEKLRPVQEKLFTAIEAVCKEKLINLMLDKAGAATVLYVDSRYDFTKDVMLKLGIDPSKTSGGSTSQPPAPPKK